MTLTAADFKTELGAIVGREDGPTITSIVEPFVIARVVEAIGDRNPVYSDLAVAEGSIHGGLVAPPTALMCWMIPVKPQGRHGVDAKGRRTFRLDPGETIFQSVEGASQAVSGPDAQVELSNLLAANGYIAPAVTNGWFEYRRYLKPGEGLVIGPVLIEEIVGPKRTSLGEGFFVTQSQKVFDTAGEVVAVMRVRSLRSKPAESTTPPAAVELSGPESIDPVQEAGETPRSGSDVSPTSSAGVPEGVAVGDRLPELVVQVTPTQVIAGALATQDWVSVHHDQDKVQTLGHPDIYMNILTSTGFVGRFVTDWAGPDTVIEAVSIRLGRPLYPSDQMLITGVVTAVDGVNGRARITVNVRGENSLGDHMVSTVKLTAPIAAGAHSA